MARFLARIVSQRAGQRGFLEKQVMPRLKEHGHAASSQSHDRLWTAARRPENHWLGF